MKRRRRNRLINRLIRLVYDYRRLLLLVAGILMVCIAGTSLLRYALRGLRERDIETELRAMMASYTAVPSSAPEETPLPASVAPQTPSPLPPSPDPSPEPTLCFTPAPTAVPTVQPKIVSLMERNPDSVGWLRSGCLSEINLPIVQRDNAFYMNHSFDGSYNEYGTAFLDALCTIGESNGHAIIYAHNMRTGQMFGKLNRLRDLKLLASDPVFVLDTPCEQINFIPVAVFTCSVRYSDETFFPIIVPRFSSEEQFNEFIERAKELSIHKQLPDAVYGERLMSLVTCYGGDEVTRFVVLLREMREGETKASVIQQMR